MEFVNAAHVPAQGTHAAFGDLNGDGLQDVAVTVAAAGTLYTLAYVAVCMNLGNGVFGAPAIYTAGTYCCAVEMGDFNRDGHLDLAAVNAVDNTVSILFNRGDGTFAAPVNYPVGVQPRSLKVADLNGDGWPDLAVLNCASNDVSILLNRRDGTFLPEARVVVGGVTQSRDSSASFPYPGPFLALADFNHDGAPDIAVPAQTRVKLLLNDGHGGFALSAVNPVVSGASAYCIAVGDLNRDGNLDMAVAVTTNGPAISVLVGRGDGTFDPVVAYDVNPLPPGYAVPTLSVAIGDLDGSGWPDLAVGYEEGHGRVALLRNRHDGTFFPREFVNADYCSWFVGLADLTGRGRPDLAALSPSTSARTPLVVHLNDGSGGIRSYVPSDLAQGALNHREVAAADIDGDGRLDLAITCAPDSNQVKICRGLGGGRFEYLSAMSFGSATQSSGWSVALVDLNNDHRPDLVVSDAVVSNATLPGRIWVVLNTGGLAFGTPTAYPLDGARPGGVVAVDLNGDGRPDLAVWSVDLASAAGTPLQRRIQVLVNNGDGSFQMPVAYPIGTPVPDGWGMSVAAADLDRDGHPDLIGVASTDVLYPPGSIVVLHNRGDGTFEPWSAVTVATTPVKVIAADFNGDGFPDLAVLHLHGGLPGPLSQPYLTILYNDRTGHFPTRSEYTNPQFLSGSGMTSADLDGDGHPDLALIDSATRSALVLLNRGDGTFDPPVGYGAGSWIEWITDLLAGDFDQSGRPGLLALQGESRVNYLPNLYCRRCYANCDTSTTVPILNAADFVCFLNRFAAGDTYANCDASTTAPVLNVNDFVCFLNRFAVGCT